MDKELIITHLSWYKENILAEKEQGIFLYKENKISEPHILPKEKASKNLINKGYFTELNDVYKSVKLHKYFHHLNSSQAFAFNLFCPLVAENKLNEFFKVSNPVKAEFEHIENVSFEPNEAYGKTNFDFFISDSSSKHFFEVKYTEDNFGYCEADENHKAKYHNFYKPVLDKICKDCFLESDFYKNYQLWRNICHVQYGDVYFVFPKFRDDFITKVNEAKNLLKEEFKNKVHIIYADEIVAEMITSGNEKLKAHYEEFLQKYLAIDE